MYKLLGLLPAPLFLLGGVYSAVGDSPICGAWQYEMPAMWAGMCLAHCRPWLLFFTTPKNPSLW
jgi:hypothetical protein